MIYLISGLSANEKAFAKINLQGRPFTFLPWIKPGKNESFDSYITRFAKSINTNEEIILIGTSFGGMVAQELAKRFEVQKIILISSIVSEKEYSPLICFFKKLKIHKLVSAKLLLNLRFIWRHYFDSGAKGEKEVLELLDGADPNIISWSINAAINWESSNEPENIYRIHGTKDLIFPLKYIGKAHLVKGGTHLMIISMADEVNKWLNEILNI